MQIWLERILRDGSTTGDRYYEDARPGETRRIFPVIPGQRHGQGIVYIFEIKDPNRNVLFNGQFSWEELQQQGFVGEVRADGLGLGTSEASS